eukprot:Clim_evm33s11 gene=Clim_evmTU33s11
MFRLLGQRVAASKTRVVVQRGCVATQRASRQASTTASGRRLPGNIPSGEEAMRIQQETISKLQAQRDAALKAASEKPIDTLTKLQRGFVVFALGVTFLWSIQLGRDYLAFHEHNYSLAAAALKEHEEAEQKARERKDIETQAFAKLVEQEAAEARGN